MSRRFMIGSGYYPATRYDPRDMAWNWTCNVMRHAKQAQKVVVISVGDSPFPFNDPHDPLGLALNVLNLPGNLGHVGDLLNGTKPHWFGGWSACVLALAMIAYNAELDLVFQESDCLCFGRCIDQMYDELEDGQMIFGKVHGQPCAQSLFLLRHSHIPVFVRDYLALGGDRDVRNLPEHKFAKLQEDRPTVYRQFSFGYDRNRPEGGLENCRDQAWYIQQVTGDEIGKLVELGML